jgi:ring-1,2-phenylacetyl-CoA epoxidase subunit PaaD
MSKTLTVTEIWQALEAVKDPEIPVVSVVEMGIVRDVIVSEERVIVKMTPTVLYPPWTTDWLSEETRARLKAFGLAPPPQQDGPIPLTLYLPVTCPYCDSADTVLKNSFGSTLCRAIYYCQSCQQPFEQFKAL